MAGEAVLCKVLGELLSKLSSPILDEFWLLWGVKKEKQKLQSNLSRIKAVLQDAERQQIDLMTDKDRLGKLKDVAYDAEDLVDEFLFEALRRKVENQDGMGRKVGNFFSPAKPLAFRFKIAHKMKELRERFDELSEENNNFQLPDRVARSPPQISNPREAASAVPDTGVQGRDDEKKELIDSLLYSKNEEVLSVIPIVGMGGLGKTTLAQLVYSHERVVTHFGLRMWVYVSDQDFIVKGVLGKILKSANDSPTVDQLSMDQLTTPLAKGDQLSMDQLTTPLAKGDQLSMAQLITHLEKDDQLSMDQLMTRLEKKLSGNRYLLVLDDVWNEDYSKWDELKRALKFGAIGSKILVTTRSGKVAETMDALPRPPLGTLSPVESWTLFEKVARPPTGFVSIGVEIVRKCGGVPLAIKTLGGMLRNETSEREWQSVRDGELRKQTDGKEKILSILRLSYDHLTSSLKQCFAYCAVIPKGRQFDKDELIKQWIAQGFIHSDDENEVPLEEEGEKCFNALLQRSLFQVDVETASNDVYKMHDLIHDLLRSVAGKECSVVEASTMNDLTPHLALCNDETRHLALCNDEWAREPKNLDALKKCKKLRSMITYGYFCPIDINVCWSFRCLRVLDLSYERIGYLPNSIDELRHLRYFDISHTLITELPETICNLHNLQTLRVLSIRLQKWPKNMKRMISLRHIEFHTGHFFPLLKGIGALTFLRTLPEFIIAKESGAGIEELKDLNLLWGNIYIGGLDNITNVGCARQADLKAKKHVNSLTLSWSWSWSRNEGNAKEVIEILEPHSDLKKLSVMGYKGLELPSWMTEKLTNLKKISLSSCKRCERLPPLGKLHFLESLEIWGMDAVKYIVEFDGSYNYEDLFPSLKDLCLLFMRNLERWSSPREEGDGDEQGRERYKQVTFECLRTLKIHGCPKLARLPWLPLLPRLESLEIGGMGWDMIEIPTSQSLMKVKLDEMPNLERWSPHEADDGTPVIFCSVRTLSISNCPKLICLPMFLLPALEELEMSEVGWESIEFSRSKSLKKVKLTKMPNLERWSPQEVDDDEQVVFDRLLELVVKECPKMVRLPHFLPSLEKLEISESNEMLLGSVANYTSLSELSITSFPEVKDFPEELGPNHTSLRKLRIENCPKLISLSNQLENLLALERLAIKGCNDLVLSLPDGLQQQQQQSPPLNSLEVLEIINSCENQISLPGDGIVLPSLKMLIIVSSKNIVSLSADMLKNLKVLAILGCPEPVMMKLLESMENLTSLTSLWIKDCPADMRSLPKSVKTFTSLTRLTIKGCPGMRSLPEWLGDLTLLANLRIEDCPGMMSLPKGLQRLKNLKFLYISQCPVLERKVQRNKGQDWHKVAHVPDIEIRRGIASQDTEGEESSDQCPHLLLHSLKKLEKLLPLPCCCSSSPSSSSPLLDDHESSSCYSSSPSSSPPLLDDHGSSPSSSSNHV